MDGSLTRIQVHQACHTILGLDQIAIRPLSAYSRHFRCYRAYYLLQIRSNQQKCVVIISLDRTIQGHNATQTHTHTSCIVGHFTQ